MVEITMQVSDSLAKRIQSFGAWSPTIVELNFAEFKSAAVKSAKNDLVRFLSRNPNSQEVLDYFLPDKSQKRLSYLLELNRAGEVGKKENAELDEWDKLEHIAVMLKAQAGKNLRRKA